ncbi:hypothetical protein K4749_01950 [Streptomyces sp. TRM72054]|uniref:hypothetical protein n=1 Tax=Streptomyces sp. TRM72054 TaxID=2870562 RepID=UPI001C8B211F|nr:hypothetical protein [Streptomyces sp. TRM72054]MBX9392388.1 hypothetical protein [Streptomyces sp. TRM72054]
MTDAARFNDVAADGLIVLLALGSLALLPVRSPGAAKPGRSSRWQVVCSARIG